MSQFIFFTGVNNRKMNLICIIQMFRHELYELQELHEFYYSAGLNCCTGLHDFNSCNSRNSI